MRRAFRMEWTKVSTDPGTRWYAIALMVTTVTVGAVATWTTDPANCTPRPCTVDAVQVSLTGIYVSQIAAVVLAVLAVGGEYDSAMIRTTLACIPWRLAVLTAKAGVVTMAVLTVATAALTATLLTARATMPGQGFTPANGYTPLMTLTEEPTRRAYIGTILYLGLIALLSLGIATMLRHSGAAITTTLGLLYVTPISALFVTDPVWQERILRYSPMTAGLAVQDAIGTPGPPTAGWSGLGVLAAYAGAAVTAGAVLFLRRDA
jgi:ABC-2 type transport system permease protein